MRAVQESIFLGPVEQENDTRLSEQSEYHLNGRFTQIIITSPVDVAIAELFLYDEDG